jgi:hypothetical protein
VKQAACRKYWTVNVRPFPGRSTWVCESVAPFIFAKNVTRFFIDRTTHLLSADSGRDQTGVRAIQSGVIRRKMDESLGVQKFEVAFAGHSGGSQVVPDDEYGHRGIFRNHDRSYDARLGERHMITFGAHTTEPIGFENFDELFIGDRPKL